MDQDLRTSERNLHDPISHAHYERELVRVGKCPHPELQFFSQISIAKYYCHLCSKEWLIPDEDFYRLCGQEPVSLIFWNDTRVVWRQALIKAYESYLTNQRAEAKIEE